MFLLDVENGVRDYKQEMISEDEELATQRHRRRITCQRQHGVVHAVPIADERIDKIKNENEGDDCRRQPPTPLTPEYGSTSRGTGIYERKRLRRVCRQRYLGQRVELRPDVP